MRPIAELLDTGESGYVDALEQQIAAVADANLTPSARLLQELEQSGSSFADFGLALARDYSNYFGELASDFNNHHEIFAGEAEASLQRQADIETADTLELDEYLKSYYA